MGNGNYREKSLKIMLQEQREIISWTGFQS